MSEDILIKMSNQIGELNGRLAATLDAQAKTNEALFKIVDAHDKEIKEIQGTKNKLIGATIVSGVSGSGIGAFLAKVFGS